MTFIYHQIINQKQYRSIYRILDMEPIPLQSIEKLLPDVKYNPYRIPPDLNICEVHYKATTFGPLIKDSKQCPCCWEKQKTTLPICCKESQITELEPTTGYFFFLIKTIILLILTVALVYGIFTFASTISTCKDDPTKCVNVNFFFFKVPFLKITDQKSPSYKTLSILTMSICVIYIVIIQYLLLKKQDKYFNLVKPSDYSILLSGVDHTKIKEKDIVEFFQKQGIQDIEILYTHKIAGYLDAEREKAKLKTKLQYATSKGLVGEELQKYKEQIKIVEEELHPIINKFYFKQQQSIRTDKIFVSFQNYPDKQRIVEKYQKSFIKTMINTLSKRPTSIQINQTYLTLEQIAQPTQILWQNLQITSYSRIVRIFIGNVVTSLLLGVAFALILVLSHLEVQDSQDTNRDIFYSYMCAVGITCVNLVLSYCVDYIAKKQRRYTSPGVTNGLMVKQTVSFFISTALMPVSMFFIYAYRPQVDNLISNVVSIFTLNSFISSITIIFTLDAIYKYYKRTRILTKSILITQYEANKYFQKNELDVDYKFALISKLSFLALFYGGAFPIGLVVSVVGLSIYYWSMKFLVIKQTKLMDTSFNVPKRMNALLCMFPVVFTSGELVNEIMINRYSTVYNLVLFIISIVISLFLVSYSRLIVKKIMKKYNVFTIYQKPKRSQAVKDGMIDYKHVNPTSYQELKHLDLQKSTGNPPRSNQNEKIPAQIASLSMYVTNNPIN